MLNKKILFIFTLFFSVYISFSTTAYAVVTQFDQGAQYLKGTYDFNAQQPMAVNWTRNSRFKGIDSDPTLKWQFIPDGEKQTYLFNSSPAIAADGTIYVGSGNGDLYAFNPDGTVKWSYKIGFTINSSPVIAEDGSIHIGTFAINPDGTKKLQAVITSYNTPAFGADGIKYITQGTKLYAINPSGTIKWDLNFPDNLNYIPIIAADGTIYVYSYLNTNGNYLYAINPDGTKKWEYFISKSTDANLAYSFPALGLDGTIYLGWSDESIHAIDNSGNLKWKYTTGGSILEAPVVGPDRTIYAGSYDNNLYALNPDGTLKWKIPIYGRYQNTPIIDSNGDLYFSAGSNTYAIYPDGTEKWALIGYTGYNSSPALAADGTIYVGSNTAFYAIGGTVNATTPSEPTNLTADVGNGQVVLNWDAVTSSNLAGYNIYQDGILIDTVTTTSYIVTGLTNGQSYTFGVSAIDTSGNESTRAQVTATPSNAIQAPMVTIEANDIVTGGSEFTVDVVIDNAVNLYAEDITIQFDTNLFEFIQAEPANPGLKIYYQEQPTAGQLRFIVASLGEANEVNGSQLLLKLTFKAKTINGTGDIAVTNGLVADGDGNELVVTVSGKSITVETGYNADVNGDGKYSLADLAIAGKHYNMDLANWLYPTSDVNVDNAVTDIDLSLIVDAIINGSI